MDYIELIKNAINVNQKINMEWILEVEKIVKAHTKRNQTLKRYKQSSIGKQAQAIASRNYLINRKSKYYKKKMFEQLINLDMFKFINEVQIE